jgi:transcriptional regulator with PAS, ATPase and Fis domain
MTVSSTTPFPLVDLAHIRKEGLAAFAQTLASFTEAGIAIDCQDQIIWHTDSYFDFIGLPPGTAVLGKSIHEVFPATQLPAVASSGVAHPFQIMEINGNWSVITRFPLQEEASGRVTGAYGFILYKKMASIQALTIHIDELRRELKTVQAKLETVRRSKYSFTQFFGKSHAVQELKWKARQAAGTDATVLLLGETGTGKELLAQALHAASSRQDGNFVGINVAAVPDELLESEFFGTAPGAFTGADPKGRKGKLALANGGTLFLDEIGDMPARMQVKLLRALQEREIEPVGSNKVVPLNVRIVAATSCDLELMVQEGRFRADLYYRLNVIPIAIPPLRDRIEDIPELADALLEDVCKVHGLPPKELTKSAYKRLQAHRWPGNVRELRNVVERAAVLCPHPAIQGDDLDKVLARSEAGPPVLHGTMTDVEKQLIQETLAKAHGNKQDAARLLGISRSTLYKKLELYRLNGAH